MGRRGRSDADSVAEDNKTRNLIGYGLKIKKYRKDRNMSAEKLADALGVTLGSIRNWECGLTRPDPEYLVRMFTILDVDPNTFFGIEGVGGSLTEAEREIIDCFRLMDPRTQGEYRAIGNALLDHCSRLRLQEIDESIIAVPDWGVYASAGRGDDWTQDDEEHQALLYNRGPAARADLVVTVSGSSMEPEYHDGDRVLVEKCQDVQYGKIYVFNIRGRGNVIKQAEEGYLHSLNEEYGDIVPGEDEEVALIGLVLSRITIDMIPTREEMELYWQAQEMLNAERE